MKKQLHQEVTGEFKKDYHTDFDIINLGLLVFWNR